jgi:uncharacterized protein YndB with AHSA1/START domain
MSFTVATTIEIERPAAEVWEVVADYERDPEWREGVVTMTPSAPGPVVVGTTTAEELHLGGNVWHNRGEVVTVDPGVAFTWHTTEGAQAHGDRRVVALGPDRSRVSTSITVTDAALAALDDAAVDGIRDALQQAMTGDGERLRDLLVGVSAAS